MSKRKQFTPQQKVAMVRRHLVENVPVSDLCDESGISIKRAFSSRQALRRLRPLSFSRTILTVKRRSSTMFN